MCLSASDLALSPRRLIVSDVALSPWGGGGVLLGKLGEGVSPGSPGLTPLQTKNVILQTRFQTWPLGRNYVIIS